ncbi:MAG: peptide chain release factor N(5)-glutamine methyltransferase [Gemmatimonadales bacterium]
MTRASLLTRASSLLEAGGIDEARREALRVWRDLEPPDGPPSPGLLDSGTRLTAKHAAAYLAAVERRAAGEPLAYVTGWTGFRHLTLRSDRRALIPRPETEGLVELVLQRAPRGRVADVGTGGGCIALSLATEGRYEAVVGVDVSPEAISLARENRRIVAGRLELVRGDLCAPLGDGTLDALVSNPPYLTSEEYGSLEPSVKSWEPAQALDGGADGLAMLRRLVADGRRVVRPGGWLALEIDATRANRAARDAALHGWTEVAIHRDLFGRERYLLARRSDVG